MSFHNLWRVRSRGMGAKLSPFRMTAPLVLWTRPGAWEWALKASCSLIDAWAKLWEIFLVVEAEQAALGLASSFFAWLVLTTVSQFMAVASLVTFFDFLSEEVMLLVTLELVAPWCPAWKADTETPPTATATITAATAVARTRRCPCSR